jgi:hypothetical protein
MCPNSIFKWLVVQDFNAYTHHASFKLYSEYVIYGSKIRILNIDIMTMKASNYILNMSYLEIKI